MNRCLLALCAVVLTFPVHAQDTEQNCIYDPRIGAFRAYDEANDSGLLGETFAGLDYPEFAVVNGMRFERADPLRGTAEELNQLIQPRGNTNGVRFFGTADTHGDLVAAIARPQFCLMQSYKYAPIVHGVWVEDVPFVFHFPALAVDRASFRLEGGIGHGIGFLMRGHPHPEENPALYYRQTIESDCKNERTRITDTRSYASENRLHQRFAANDEWVANDDLTHPATQVLARLVCNPPAEWPAGTRIESLDAFSQQVHQAAHSQ